MENRICHPERSKGSLITQMFESLVSCFTFRCSASLNSPQDESAVADMTMQARTKKPGGK
jgi:hypothetical protein